MQNPGIKIEVGYASFQYQFSEMQSCFNYIFESADKSFKPIDKGLVALKELSDFIAEFHGSGRREWLGSISNIRDISRLD